MQGNQSRSGRHTTQSIDGRPPIETSQDKMMEGDEVDDPHFRHLFDGNTAFNVYKKDIVNLSVGAPGPDLLKNCGKMMLKATEHRTAEEEKEGMHYLYQYGLTAGLWECREELSKFLTRRYQDSPVKRENLVLTCGATHGLQLLLTTILSPNGVIFVEEVTYMIALDAFRQFPLIRIVTIPMKEKTVDLEAFDRIVEEEKGRNNYYLSDQKIFWGIFYTIPTYHNPTGMVLPRDKCKMLVEIARKHSIAVACDDVYNLLHYKEGPPPRRLLAHDSPEDSDYKGGNVISNGSFSKILSPAIRLGWIEGPPRVIKILRTSGVLQSGGALNHYVSGVITSLLELKYADEHVDLLQRTYAERLAAVCDTFDRYLPRCCSYDKPEGGYFVWITLPPECDASEFMKWCSEKYKVTAIPGSRFSNTGEAKNFLRLSFSFHPVETLRDAAQKLCEGMLDYVRNHMKKP
ncbi:uncharacterized protein LOC107042891 isoform X2 [Diachasma alloeum]|uniref:uncharacterized protein LOC107042891 isoform X2 n=1 Tax=Diachasma alloeum TaxID=454923 RepID=UPI0007384B81|nr:uncharacterized protein LOC107042891 isoform X2 [Diachasma alloeum]XP_015119615.1 uncharacterized protein LOC107042891 isoform X2 [Diachasma alloeum]